MRKETSELQTKLKKADPIVRDYIAELESRNAKRQHQIVKLEADKMERDNKIQALEKEIRENKPQLHVNIASHREPTGRGGRGSRLVLN